MNTSGNGLPETVLISEDGMDVSKMSSADHHYTSPRRQKFTGMTSDQTSHRGDQDLADDHYFGSILIQKQVLASQAG